MAQNSIRRITMIIVDTNSFDISMTRGDTAQIVFSAIDESGDNYSPNVGDVLTFSVAKKYGAEPLFSVSNTYNGDATAWWTITIGEDVWVDDEENDKFKFTDYVYDVQITTSTDIYTIIGKTDEISPRFRVWGEVAE